MSLKFKTPSNLEELHQLQRETTELLKTHRLAVAINKLCPKGQSDIQRQSLLSRYENENELIAAAGGVVEDTQNVYLRRGRGVLVAASKQGRNVWELVEERSGNKDSWYALKAALRFFLMAKIQQLKAIIDAWQRLHRAGKVTPEQDKACKMALRLLPEYANALASTPQDGAPAKFSGVDKSERRSNSKSASVRRRPSDWRERVVAQMDAECKLPYLMACVAGCRPVELKKGDGVTAVLRADGSLELTTPGAKLGKHAGQAMRQVIVPTQAGIASLLAQLLSVDVPVQSAPLLANLTVEAYRKRVARGGERAFPDEKPKRRLTAYSTRHQFRADLRAAGLSREQQAQGMGHATTRSATYYGIGARSGNGSIAPTEVSASRPVKQRAPYPKQAKTVGLTAAPTKPAKKSRLRKSSAKP